MHGHYIVEHPYPAPKILETAIPMSCQAIEFLLQSSLLVLVPPPCPNFSRMWVTKVEGVSPPLEWALTDNAKDLVMSKRACASATCSLGVVTEKRQNSKPLYVCVMCVCISLNVGITYQRIETKEAAIA